MKSKMISSIIIIILLPQLSNAWRYQVPSIKVLKKNEMFPSNSDYWWPPERLEPGLSVYRKTLPLRKDYLDDPKAKDDLLIIRSQLEASFKKGSAKYWLTKDNVTTLMEFIKKYPRSRQAVTAKLYLSKVLNTPFVCDTLPSQYWAIDLWRELYCDFPDKWQGKFALFYFYRYMFWIGGNYNIEWSYQFLDDFEAINRELEEVYQHPDKYPDFDPSHHALILYDYTHWRYPAEVYCGLKNHVWIIENGLKDDVIAKSKGIYLHMRELCEQGRKDCAMSQDMVDDFIQYKKRGETSIGPCVPDEFE